MVETLRTATQLLEDYADNTAGLIAPIHTRQHVVSGANDLAFVFEAFEPVSSVSPTLDPTDTNLTTLWATPNEAFRFWAKDGNGRLFPDYGAVTVDPGTTRLSQIRWDIAVKRQAPAIPGVFGGNYEYLHNDGAPGTGDIAANANLTSTRINHTDDDGNNLQAELEALQPEDLVNIGGVLFRVQAVTPNLNDVEITHDSTTRLNELAQNDTMYAQGLARPVSQYRFSTFKDGAAAGTGVLFDVGNDLSLVSGTFATVQDYSLGSLWDVRVAKIDTTDPGLDIGFLGATVSGLLL